MSRTKDEGRRTKDEGSIIRPSSFVLRPSSHTALLWTLVLTAFLIRVGYNLALHPQGHPPSAFIIDEAEYFGAAHMLAEGRGFSFFDTALWVRAPLYVVFLSGLMSIFGGSAYLPILLLQSLLSALTLLPLGWLAEQIGGRAAALWAVALGAVYLPFTLFAGLLLSESLYLLLFALTLVALLRAREYMERDDRSQKLEVRNQKSEVRNQKLVLPPLVTRHVSRFTFHVSRPLLFWSALAGGLLGLATLTRATTLGFVPLAAVWLWLGARGLNARKGLLAAGLATLVCVLTLLPWTVRNYTQYRQLVVVDTTSGYNLWLASQGVRDEERMVAELRPLANPAERQSYAFARAWENIAADPSKFVGKGLKESLDLWQPLFSAEERQVRGYTLGRVPAWHIAALFLFDDLLYVAILLMALLGFALSPPHPLKLLLGLWVLLWVGIAFIFFAVTRFRLPIVAALLPLAGAGIAYCVLRIAYCVLRWTNLKSAIQNLKSVGLLLSVLAVLLVTLPAISAPDMVLGIERWGQQSSYREGRQLLQEGRVEEAIRLFGRANPDLIDTRYSLAAAYLQRGQIRDALAQLREDEPPDRYEPYIIRGEAARIEGDLEAARQHFNARVVQVAGEEALEWAWDHLKPPPTDAIELGSGLDIGYVRGFYGPERGEGGKSFRWMGSEAQVRGLSSTDVEARWSGWRSSNVAGASVLATWTNGRSGEGAEPLSFELLGGPPQIWEVVSIGPRHAQGVDVSLDTLSLRVNPFIGGGNDPRLLGVRIACLSVRGTVC